MTRFDLNTVVEEVCQGLAPAVLSRDLEFSLDRSAQPLMMDGDPTLLGEAFTNLVENALRHGGDAMTRIVVRTALEGEVISVTVQDDGVGIPLDEAETAFRRFSQLQSGEGTGLGLAIVEQVMRKHRGSVRLESVERGTSVRLEVPRAEASPAFRRHS